MKEILIQNRVVDIPTTAGDGFKQILIKADDCYEFLTGVAAYAKSAPRADVFEIELRDDFNTILSFSPWQNWLKNPSSVAYNLQDAFKPLNVNAKGRNFYLNIRYKNITAFSFVVLFRQSVKSIDCRRYDIQSWTIAAPSLGATYEITLPGDYDFCKGIAIAGGDVANDMFLGFDISDAAGAITDPVPLSILRPSENSWYDNGFFDVDFESKIRQIRVRLTALGTLPATYTATDYTISFLLV